MLTDKKLDTNDMTKEEVIELMEEYRKAYEEATRKPRDISELLKLDTYQDMTDEEIELVFDFKLRMKMTQYIAKQEADKFEVERIHRLKEMDANFTANHSVVQSLLNKRPTLIESLDEVMQK